MLLFGVIRSDEGWVIKFANSIIVSYLVVSREPGWKYQILVNREDRLHRHPPADVLHSANIIQFSTIHISHFIFRGRREDNLAILAITKLHYNPGHHSSDSMQSEEFSGNDKSIECWAEKLASVPSSPDVWSLLWIFIGLQMRRDERPSSYYRQTNLFPLTHTRWLPSALCQCLPSDWRVLQQYRFPLIYKYYKHWVSLQDEMEKEECDVIWVIWRLMTEDDQFGTGDRRLIQTSSPPSQPDGEYHLYGLSFQIFSLQCRLLSWITSQLASFSLLSPVFVSVLRL